jgi:hypothetical protein
MNLRSPSDGRHPSRYPFKLPDGQGTFIYDEYLEAMEKAGINWLRLWMAPWWCGLEWRGDWYGFHGVGRYNLQNAWRLDYLLEQCERRGIYVELCLTNHGQFSTEVDEQWADNPYNADNGGMMGSATDLFHPERPGGRAANEKLRDRLRYIVARWGYSTYIVDWALFTEVEFTAEYWTDAAKQDHDGSYRCSTVADWHSLTARYLKTIDPFGHLVATHFSHPWRGADVWERPELDLVTSNAYSAYPLLGQQGEPEAIRKYYHERLGRFGRPLLIGEFGGHWIKNPADVLDHELHSGLWSCATTPLAGATGFWWWLHVHFNDRYHHFKALSDYMNGEDFRGQDLQQRQYQAGSLQAQALQNDSRAYAWVYHRRFDLRCQHNWGEQVDWSPAQPLEDFRETPGQTLVLTGLQPGKYRVEFWDTYQPTGKPFEAREMTFREAYAPIPLPTVRNDVAVKVKFLGR